MTMSISTTTSQPPRTGALERSVAMRLAATEYERVTTHLRSLSPQQWAAPTSCPGWDVRAMAGHVLGMVRMAASMREQSRQTKTATARGGLFIDALTALQVEDQAGLSTDQLIAALEKYGPKAARGRKRAPGFIRRRKMPVPQHLNGVDEFWTIGYLLDIILTRDPWMHRSDIARATGTEMVLTADHDGVLVDDAVREWAARHAQPVNLRLTGPAGGTWSFGTGGPALEYDAVDFCRILSGRGTGEGLLTTEVPF